MTTSSESPRRSLLPVLIVVAGLFALAGGILASWWLNAPQPPRAPEELTATYIPGGKPIGDFTLSDHHGQVFDKDRLAGRWTFVFIGYTYCPDVCPTTLQNMASVYDTLLASAPGAPIQTVFISVDPKRDTPARLAQYAPFFHRDFLGVTGEEPELNRLVRDLGAIYVIQAPAEGRQHYDVDHSTSVLLLNPEGRLQALFRPPLDPKVVEKDFRKIAQAYRSP